ncbi:galactoside alpha-(1,2)-fucosyltransferase 2-like [Paramacrobiotus metropolitanus]|uniref:galactoside alpha-(1,2)-fucosyltransferase 2-like n=1 Tax=Paramacrobiotus metropolitanus TaxID=2943436 RepID=UPI0024462348|nr:galactoside alpha-(1,2)-fucosyltransferase 2-like [Paramacrobiotus metropolitanus]
MSTVQTVSDVCTGTRLLFMTGNARDCYMQILAMGSSQAVRKAPQLCGIVIISISLTSLIILTYSPGTLNLNRFPSEETANSSELQCVPPLTAADSIGKVSRLTYASKINSSMIDEILMQINAAGDPLQITDDLSLKNQGFILKLTVQRLRMKVSKRLKHASYHLAETSRIMQSYENKTPLFISSNFDSQGGLGNWMFMMASMFGLSRTNKRIPVVLYNYSAFDRHFANFKLMQMDRVTFAGNSGKAAWEAAMLREIAPGVYTDWLANVSSKKRNMNVLLEGYLQSWKYFHEYRADIQSLFTFSQDVYVKSVEAISTGLQNLHDASPDEVLRPLTMPTLIGIHVRRGDILNFNQRDHGHRPATDQYLLRAALRFQRMFAPVIFVVVSNDIQFCKNLFPEPNFVFIENTSPEVDMAILTLMDNLILTVGSFGWWGAYLSDARQVVYYRNWPESGSDMENMFEPGDYFPSFWEGLL